MQQFILTVIFRGECGRKSQELHSWLLPVIKKCNAVSLLCVIFAPNSGYITRYAPFIWQIICKMI